MNIAPSLTGEAVLVLGFSVINDMIIIILLFMTAFHPEALYCAKWNLATNQIVDLAAWLQCVWEICLVHRPDDLMVKPTRALCDWTASVWVLGFWATEWQLCISL